METRKFAIPKKGMEDIIIGMNLDPNARYEIHNIIEGQGNLPKILELKTESGNILPYHAFPFDIYKGTPQLIQ